MMAIDPIDLIRKYSLRRRPLSVSFRDLVAIPGYPDVATHQLHPYPAKLLGHIPRWFLQSDSWHCSKGILLDPFCGSGTVLLEGALVDRELVGADANPMARLITRVKISPPSACAAESAVERVLSRVNDGVGADVPDVVNINHWYTDRSIDQLGRLRAAILREAHGPVLDFLWVLFSRTVRDKSRANPRIAVPVRLRLTRGGSPHPLQSQARALALAGGRNSAADVFSVHARNALPRLTDYEAALGAKTVSLSLRADARQLQLRPSSVATVITSPPYATAQKYIRATSLSACWLGLATSSSLASLVDDSIGNERLRRDLWEQEIIMASEIAAPFLKRVYASSPERAAITARYLNDMKRFWHNLRPTLRSGAGVVMVVGDNTVTGERFNAARYAKVLANEIGLTLKCELRDQIRGRALVTSRNGGHGIIDHETILVWSCDV